MKHHVIYVPGIDDNIGYVQSAAVRLWRIYGVRGHFHIMPWRSEETWQTKFNRLLAQIDDLRGKGDTVSLVGASAGGSAALNAYVARRNKVSGVVLVCSKVKHPETVFQRIYAQSPALKDSLEQLQPSLAKLTAKDKAKIRSYYSPVDRTVSYADSAITDVEEVRLPSFKHSYAIAYAIFIRAHHLLTFLKQTT